VAVLLMLTDAAALSHALAQTAANDRAASVNAHPAVRPETGLRRQGVKATQTQSAQEARSGASAGASSASRRARSVDVNLATAAELEQVRGIGPALAGRIESARNQGGRFRDADELRKRVRGIGEANLRRMIAGGLVIGGPAVLNPALGALRERVELIVGNAPSKGDGRGHGRIEELGCCRGTVTPDTSPSSHRGPP
jgi:DNA uptake protein ComE-like DNA-binding protein